MPTTNTADRSSQDNDRRSTLDQHYRAIGISAVAAAARYPAETRRAVYAPAYTREQD